MKFYKKENNSSCNTNQICNDAVHTSCDVISSPELITNIGLTYPGTVMPLKPISANECNSLVGFNQLGLNEIIPCNGYGCCSNTLKITGNLRICQNLYVHGIGYFYSNVIIDGNLDVSGNTSIGGDLDVSGNTSIGGDLDVSGNVDFDGNLDVSGNVDICGNLTVIGHTLVCDLSACNVDISENLEVFGHTRFVDASGSGIISLFDPTTKFSTDINSSSIINDNIATRMHPMLNMMGPIPSYGLTLQTNNLYIDLRETSNAQGGFGVAIKLADNDEFSNFRILGPAERFAAVDYIFQVDGSGVTQARDIYPWGDCAWNLGKPTKRWNLYACNIIATDISGTNLSISGNSWLNDISGSNLSISGNTWLNIILGTPTFNVDTVFNQHLQFVDASGTNLTITGNFWVVDINFTNGYGENLTLTDTLKAKTICAEHPTPTAGVLCVKDGNPNVSPNGALVFKMNGATGVLDIGTQNTLNSHSGRINLHNNGYNDIVVSLDAGTNSQNQLGEIRVGKYSGSNGTTKISGGWNYSSIKTRGIDSSGSLLANSIIHVNSGPGSGTEKNSFLCMGGVPHKDWSLNDPTFHIKTIEPASGGNNFGLLQYKFSNTSSLSTIIGLKVNASKKRMSLGRDAADITNSSFPINIHVCDTSQWQTAGGMQLPSYQSNIQGTSPMPSWTNRDPSNTICFNSNLFINRQTGIVIDAMDWDVNTNSWAGAESALFIGKVNNHGDLRANSIVSPYKIGVQIGAGGDFGATGCTIIGNIRNGTNASNVYSFQTGNSHTGYIGSYASSTWLGVPTDGTKFKGYAGDFFKLNLGQVMAAASLAFFKAFNIENEKYADFGPSGEQLTFSAVEAPESDCLFRGQSFVPAGRKLDLDMDKECSKFFNGNEDGTIPKKAPNSDILNDDPGLLEGTFYSNFVYDPSGNWDTTGGKTGSEADLWCEANLNVQLTAKFNPGGSGGGGSGNFVLPYEPYNMNTMLSQWPLSPNSWVWYVQFTASCTGSYSHMRFFTTHASTSTYNGILGVAIYSDNPGQPGLPHNLIGQGKISLSNENMDLRYNDITFDAAVDLSANTRYWVAVAAVNNSGEELFSGFHNDYNGGYNVVKYQKNGFTGTGGFQAAAASGGTFYQGEYAYWFRIYSDVGGGFNGTVASSNTYHYRWSCIDFTTAHGISINGKKVMLKIFQNDGEAFSVNQVINWTITASRQDKRMYEMAQKYNADEKPGLGPASSLSQIRDVIAYNRPEDTAYFLSPMPKEKYQKMVWNPRCYKEPPLDLSGNPIRRLDSFQ
jgi:cytoskeletal protein CcmA (bactofilin family)